MGTISQLCVQVLDLDAHLGVEQAWERMEKAQGQPNRTCLPHSWTWAMQPRASALRKQHWPQLCFRVERRGLSQMTS